MQLRCKYLRIDSGITIKDKKTQMTTYIIIIAIVLGVFLLLRQFIYRRRINSSLLPSKALAASTDSVPLTKQQLESLIGRTGIACNYMFPYGKIEIDSHLVEAIAEQMPIQQGDSVRVIRTEGFRVVVIPANISVIPIHQ